MKQIIILLFLIKTSLAQVVKSPPITMYSSETPFFGYYYSSLNFKSPRPLSKFPIFNKLIETSKSAKNLEEYQKNCIDFKPNEIPIFIKSKNLAVQNAYSKLTKKINSSLVLWHLIDTLSNEIFTVKTIKNEKGNLFFTNQTFDEDTVWLFENLKPDIFDAVVRYSPKTFALNDLKQGVGICYYDPSITIYSPCLSQYFKSIKGVKKYNYVFR